MNDKYAWLCVTLQYSQSKISATGDRFLWLHQLRCVLQRYFHSPPKLDPALPKEQLK